MAKEVFLEKGELRKKGIVGFSWTMFFFGFFVPLSRGDFKWFLVTFMASIITFGLFTLVFAFFYNRIYTSSLLEQGYYPADDYSKSILKSYELIRMD